jgi:hypothetical protein
MTYLYLTDSAESPRIFNKIFSGYQPHQMVKRRKHQRFEDHLCPCPQGTEVAGVPICVIYILAPAPYSWLRSGSGRYIYDTDGNKTKKKQLHMFYVTVRP